jgi:hypothetical protein
MKKYTTVFFAVAFLASIGVQLAAGGEIDILLQKLVEKGVLTDGEASQIAIETKEEVRKDLARGKSDSVPAWVQNVKLKGDVRVRLQNNHPKSTNDTSNERLRARLRVRTGITAKVNEKLMAAIGFATGLSDGSSDAARSTNATLENGFSKKQIALDYAYAQYSPLSWLTMTGGKISNPLWEPTDLIWDTDINPEGGAVILSKELVPGLKGKLVSAAYVLDELSSEGSDPMLYLVQGDLGYALNSKVSLRGALTYYNFSNVQGRKLDGTTSTNTVSGSTSAGALKYHYTPLSPALELKVSEPFGSVPLLSSIPSLSLFGEYVYNGKVKENNTGYSCGFKVGADKIAKWGDWDMKYIFAMLGKDAMVDILPDSDRYSGKTNIRGHEAQINWGLGTNTFLSFDVYRAWTLAANTAPETLVQVDWNMKF